MSASGAAITKLRAQLPAIARWTHLNAAAASPLPLPVHQAVVAHSQETVEQGDLGFAAWLRRKEEIRSQLARLLGVEASDLAFVGSTSMGFNVAAQLLVRLGVTEVLTLGQEFPSTTVPLLHHGLTLRVVEPDAQGAYPIDVLEAALAPTTRAVAVSAVQYASGFRVDLDALASLCRARGLYLLLNVAQAAGQIPLDAARWGAHVVAGTSHKWLMGGYGVGFVAVRGELIEAAGLPLAGWLSVPDPLAMAPFPGSHDARVQGVRQVRGVQVEKVARALEVGAHAMGTLLGLGEALALLDEVGTSAIEGHNQALQRALRQGLRELGFRPNAPDEASAGICVVAVEGDPRRAVKALLEERVVVTARGGGVRVSTHVYNDEGDLQRLFEAVRKQGLRPA